MFYRLDFEIGENCSFIKEINISVDQKQDLIHGKRIEIFGQPDVELIRKDIHPDLMGDSITKPIINAKIKTILERYEDKTNLQFIPVNGCDEDRWLLNILNNVEAFDWEKSTFTTFSNPKALRKVTNLVLKKNIIGNRNIFKLEEKPVGIFISETLKQAFEAEGVTGIVISDNMDLSVGI